MRLKQAEPDFHARLFMKPADGGYWTRWDLEPAAPTSTALNVYLVPQVNDGRWIVGCPGCGGAQLALSTVDMFFCVECLNAWQGGQWVVVQWPPERAEIEAVLGLRFEPRQANWNPGDETVADLWSENVEQGLHDWDQVPAEHRAAARQSLEDRLAASRDAHAIKIADHLELPDGRVITVLTPQGRELAGDHAEIRALESAAESWTDDGMD